jgi:predicted dehydrogenase
VLAAARRGVHVLCQKPLATSVQEATAMLEACERAGVRCIINENWRWRRAYRELGELLQAGEIGRPRYACVRIHGDDLLPKPDGARPALLARQPYTAEMPHLILYEWGIHFIDVMRFLFGDIAGVVARMHRLSPLVRGEDLAVVLLDFAAGVTGIIDLSWTSYVSGPKRVTRGNLDPFTVEGDSGTVTFDPYHEDSIVVTTGRGSERRAGHPGRTAAEAYQDSFDRAQEHFIRCLRSGEAAENEGRDNLKTFAATMAAYESAQTGRRVALG